MSHVELAERRRHLRLPINLDLMLTIVLPEETFTPYKRRGVTTDLSASGACIKTYQLSRRDFSSLMKAIRFAKLELEPPGQAPITLKGQIVWMDYHDATKFDRSYCMLGISLVNVPEEYRELVSSLSLAMANPPNAIPATGVDVHATDHSGAEGLH